MENAGYLQLDIDEKLLLKTNVPNCGVTVEWYWYHSFTKKKSWHLMAK